MKEIDAEFFDRELRTFLPQRVFDAHSHLWHDERFVVPGPDLPPVCGMAEYATLIKALHPGRTVAGLFIPFPHKQADFDAANQWIASEITRRPRCRGLYLVRPTDDPEWVRQEVRQLRLHGLKCYHVYADREATMEADIPEYLPEPLVKVAHEEGWVITLHMVKRRAVADAGNIYWIRHYCETYPNMKLILAHAARGFQPAHNLEGLPQLIGLDNLFFDSSANCEPIAHQAILRTHGHRKLLYGTDFHISHFRGRCVAGADSFLWLYGDNAAWRAGGTVPVLVGLESLRALKWACWAERLTDAQVEDVFWTNATALFDAASS